MLEEQRQVCERYGSGFYGVDLSLKVGIALETLNHVPIHALRSKEENGTSGWYIWGGEYSDAPDFFKPLCGRHLGKYCPLILKYLALQPGFRLIIDDDGYEDVWFDEAII